MTVLQGVIEEAPFDDDEYVWIKVLVKTGVRLLAKIGQRTYESLDWLDIVRQTLRCQKK